MGLESKARRWAFERGLQRSRVFVTGYRAISQLRFRGRWEDEVEFRGHHFRIGRDLSLFPAVHNGGFEAEELDAFLPLVPNDAVIWDVGANIGIYAVLLAAAAPNGHVEAFEPVPDSHQRLLNNLTANGVANVTTHALALSDSAGTVTMSIHPDAHGCDQIGRSANTSDTESIDVQTRTGDDFLARTNGTDPDVVKVDIEGHEPQFLAGAWAMFERRSPLLLIEINPAAWSGEAHRLEWQQAVDRLFALYNSALLFETAGPQAVNAINVAELDDTRAYSVLFLDPSR